MSLSKACLKATTRLWENAAWGFRVDRNRELRSPRTLLTHYHILILDDSTSAVDAETADRIQASLDKIMKERTCNAFVIAQRISTIQSADRILLIDDGKLAAQGTHEELMRTSSLYGAILESQVKQQSAVVV